MMVLSFDTSEFEQLLRKCIRDEMKSSQPDVLRPVEPAFLSKKQAAAKMGCSTNTIDRKARSGELERHYIGSKAFFKTEQVLALAKPALSIS